MHMCIIHGKLCYDCNNTNTDWLMAVGSQRERRHEHHLWILQRFLSLGLRAQCQPLLHSWKVIRFAKSSKNWCRMKIQGATAYAPEVLLFSHGLRESKSRAASGSILSTTVDIFYNITLCIYPNLLFKLFWSHIIRHRRETVEDLANDARSR